MELKELIAFTILAMIFCLTALVLLVFYFQKKYGDDEADEIEEREDLRDYEKYRHWSED
jgi:preprotein translocase subunit SecG